MILDANLHVVRAEGPGRGRDDGGVDGWRGRRVSELVSAGTLDAVLPGVRRALAGREHTAELPVGSDGSVGRLWITPRRDRDGHVDGAVVFCSETFATGVGADRDDSQQLYRLLADSATDVVTLRDRDGIYRYVSPSGFVLTGYRAEEQVGRAAIEFVHPDDRALAADVHRRLAADDDVVEFECRLAHRDGHTVWARTAARAVRDPLSGELTAIRTSTQDVSEHRARETQLRETTTELKRRLRERSAIAEFGEQALHELDLEWFLNDATAKIAELLDVPMCAVLIDDGVHAGWRVKAGTGWHEETIGRSIGPIANESWPGGPGQAPVVFDRLPPSPSWARLLREHGVVDSLGLVLADRDDRPMGVLAVHTHVHRTFSDDDRAFLIAVASIVRDAIALHRAEDAAIYDALHDVLTGLPNRRLLTDRLEHALARSLRSGERHALLFLDVDHFKLVNDSLGHEAGDQLLRRLGPHLRAAVRPADTVARFGGDEFVVLCENVPDEQQAGRIAQCLLDSVDQSFELGGREHVTTVSIGVAMTNRSCTPEAVLRDADTAMYRAKERGRGRFEIFDPAMRRRAVARLALEDELRRALSRDELTLLYQPIFPIDAFAPTMVEALVRWQHPDRGLLSPSTFIPIAEETNLIVPLGAQIMHQACTQVARWRRDLPEARQLALAVNVSARQISHPGFGHELVRMLERTGLPAHALCLEITEGVLLQDSETNADTLSSLREYGIRIVLDDFGTGYSSLGYLRRYALDLLKVDRSFVSELDERIEVRAIVDAIIRMANAFGLDVVAEGVETPQQLQALRELGCANVQGYLLSRPLSAVDLQARLRTSRLQPPEPRALSAALAPAQSPAPGRIILPS